MSNFYAGQQGDGGDPFYNYSGNQAGGGYGQNQQYNQQSQQQQYSGGGGGGSSSGGYPGSDVHQWQASHQQQYSTDPRQQQQQQQQYHQKQPYGGGSGGAAQSQPFWTPAATTAITAMAGQMATGKLSNDAIFDIGMNAGKSVWEDSAARLIPGLVMMRDYFAVDNQYVVSKMKKVLFPFKSKQWKRLHSDPSVNGGTAGYELPTQDENAPDLYLPCMSLITYVLLCALCYGSAGEFDPEVIPDVTSKCFITQVLEVLAIRFGLYMMQTSIPFLSLFSYTGYKYLGLCINMAVGLLLGHFGFGARGYYATFLWTASAASYFMLKTMANNIPLETAAGGPKREVMVIVFAASQFATMWFVSQTKFL